MEEKELISQLQSTKSKAKAFEILVDLYQKRLYWYIRRIVISHDDANDVLQDCFVKIFQNIEKFRSESSLFSWIYRIATNQSIDFLKKKANEKRCSVEMLQYDRVLSLETDVYFEGDEMQIKFQQAISKLPEKQQLVFNMKYFQEMKYEEISEILGTSVGALKASYHHAVQKIKIYLEMN